MISKSYLNYTVASMNQNKIQSSGHSYYCLKVEFNNQLVRDYDAMLRNVKPEGTKEKDSTPKGSGPGGI